MQDELCFEKRSYQLHVLFSAHTHPSERPQQVDGLTILYLGFSRMKLKKGSMEYLGGFLKLYGLKLKR